MKLNYETATPELNPDLPAEAVCELPVAVDRQLLNVLGVDVWLTNEAERDRPHRLLFILQGGHMSGGAGLHQYIEAHRDELADVEQGAELMNWPRMVC